jgi:putative ABC transport system permease protein
MLRHFWNTAVRNLFRNKLFSIINIIGLSLSIAIFLAITGYIRYQFSFDHFYKNGSRIYRIDYYEYQEGLPVLSSARTHDRTALLVHEYAPQVEAVTRVFNEKAYVFTEDVRIVDQDMLFVDSSFFKVFDVNLLIGSPDQVLKAPLSVVISESQAKVYFGSQNPIGKTLYFNERLPFVVTGIFEDIPANSSLDFDFLLSWSTLPFYGWASRDGDFKAPYTLTYVKLKEHATDLEAIDSQLTAMVMEHNTTLEKRNHTARHMLKPYEDLHTSVPLSGEVKPATSKTLLYTLLSLAAFVLVAAWINYINLSLARSLERADEIGVRKVFGASRMAISSQFLLEAFILAVITFCMGFGLFILFTGPLSTFIFPNITFASITPLTLVIYFTGFIAVTTLVSFYPAHFISKYKPALILRNKLGSGKGNANFLQQSLLIFQFFFAVAIVGITLVASQQVSFLRNFDSGFNAKQTITLRAPASTNSDSLRQSRYRSFRNEVLQQAAFQSGTASMNIPGQEIRFHDEAVYAVGSKNEKKQSFWIMWIDEGYVKTFGLSMIGGRDFKEREFGPTCLINETAAIALGYKNPQDAVNSSLITGDQKIFTVAGVMKDYHHESLRKPVEAIIFFHHHPHEYGYYSFSVQARPETYLEPLQKIWHKHYPNDQFIYYFMDRFFEAQYQSDQLFSRLLNLFSIISITVASLGLFGMATLAMVKRTKEIAVRKVLGATVMNILAMLSRTYVMFVLLGCAFAFPLAYYLTSQWLSGFAYKIEIEWWMIILPGIIVLMATLLTIAGQSIRAAIANPSKSLRDQ